MPRRIAMSTLIERCKRRADKEFESHISDAEWRALISEQYGDLFSVVAGTGMRYFESTSTYTTDGSEYVAEPDDILAMIGLDYVRADLTRRELIEIMAQERTRVAGTSGSEAAYFALVDDRIYFYPTPAAGQTYEILYIPQASDLSAYADSDIVDVVTPDGESFLLWGVAVKALAKSESDVRLALAEREAARQRLLDWATMRAFNSPRRRIVVDHAMDDLAYGVDPGDWRFR